MVIKQSLESTDTPTEINFVSKITCEWQIQAYYILLLRVPPWFQCKLNSAN